MKLYHVDWSASRRSWQFKFGVDYAHGNRVVPWFLWIYIGPATLTLHGKERS